MNKYTEIKNRHAKESETLPIFFAFNKAQFEKGMIKCGLEITDTDKIFKTAGGGFYKKEDSQIIKDHFIRQEKEMADAIESDKTGEGFIFDMFNYELGNHEYVYTMDDTDTLEALGITYKDIKESEALANGLRLAKIEQREE